MSITFEKTVASKTQAKDEAASHDGTMLLVTAILLLITLCGFVAILPVAPGGDVDVSILPFGP